MRILGLPIVDDLWGRWGDRNGDQCNSGKCHQCHQGCVDGA